MTNIRILYWNIHGISSRTTGEKNNDQQFLNVVSKYDIVCLSELHANKAVSIPGYAIKKQKFRPKTHKGPKIGGGIAVFVKQSMSQSFRIIPNNNVDSIWLQTKSDNVSAMRVGFYYCSPESTSTNNFVKTISGEIEKFGNDTHTYIFGDFNARTKTAPENITFDKYDEELGIPTEMHFTPIARNSEDTKLINTRGKDFLDICRIHDLCIANGRTLGDIFGKYTCHQKKGSSVVDYLISPYKALKNITNFAVGDYMPDLSDHCPLQSTIRSNIMIEERVFNEVHLKDTPNRYIWRQDSSETFRTKLRSPDFKEKVQLIL